MIDDITKTARGKIKRYLILIQAAGIIISCAGDGDPYGHCLAPPGNRMIYEEGAMEHNQNADTQRIPWKPLKQRQQEAIAWAFVLAGYGTEQWNSGETAKLLGLKSWDILSKPWQKKWEVEKTIAQIRGTAPLELDQLDLKKVEENVYRKTWSKFRNVKDVSLHLKVSIKKAQEMLQSLKIISYAEFDTIFNREKTAFKKALSFTKGGTFQASLILECTENTVNNWKKRYLKGIDFINAKSVITEEELLMHAYSISVVEFEAFRDAWNICGNNITLISEIMKISKSIVKDRLLRYGFILTDKVIRRRQSIFDIVKNADNNSIPLGTLKESLSHQGYPKITYGEILSDFHGDKRLNSLIAALKKKPGAITPLDAWDPDQCAAKDKQTAQQRIVEKKQEPSLQVDKEVKTIERLIDRLDEDSEYLAEFIKKHFQLLNRKPMIQRDVLSYTIALDTWRDLIDQTDTIDAAVKRISEHERMPLNTNAKYILLNTTVRRRCVILDQALTGMRKKIEKVHGKADSGKFDIILHAKNLMKNAGLYLATGSPESLNLINPPIRWIYAFGIKIIPAYEEMLVRRIQEEIKFFDGTDAGFDHISRMIDTLGETSISAVLKNRLYQTVGVDLESFENKLQQLKTMPFLNKAEIDNDNALRAIINEGARGQDALSVPDMLKDASANQKWRLLQAFLILLFSNEKVMRNASIRESAETCFNDLFSPAQQMMSKLELKDRKFQKTLGRSL